MAKERDQDDHIDWLLEKKKYEVCVIKLCALQKVTVCNCTALTLCALTAVWLWQEALMAAEISFKNIKRHDVQKIGMAYINHLVEKGDYDSAARWVLHVLQMHSQLM